MGGSALTRVIRLMATLDSVGEGIGGEEGEKEGGEWEGDVHPEGGIVQTMRAEGGERKIGIEAMLNNGSGRM